MPEAPAVDRIVTGISASTKGPGRFVIEVNRSPIATLTLDVLERLGVRVGVVMSDALAASLLREARLLGTFDRAINMLASRARSAKELRRRLVQKGEPSEAADAAIERLIAIGALNDSVYARQFARAKMIGAGIARRRIWRELVRRGVTGELAQRAIDEAVSDDSIDEGEILVRVAQKKLRALSSLDAATRRRRLFAFLARRGYDVVDIQRVTRELLAPANECDDMTISTP